MREMPATARRLLALLFLLIMVAFIAGSLALYAKTFDTVTRVTLLTDDVGYALPKDADVKTRGVLVGRVTDVAPQGEQVAVTLDLDPQLVADFPSNVTARLLPKTLFGERFVELKLPAAGQAGGNLHDGDIIAQDAAGNAVELDQLLDNLLPVLQAVPPQDLAATLGALANALHGNGDRLGAAFEQAGEVFAGINEVDPQLRSGLEDLATFSQTYAEAVPDLVAALDAMRTTSATVVDKQDQLARSIQLVTTASGDLAGWLDTNGQNVINLAADSHTVLDYLARYSPSLPCAVYQFDEALQRSDAILGVGTDKPGIRVTVEFSNPRGRYIPNQDEPRYFETRGPVCYPEAPPGERFGQAPHGALADGAYQPPSRNPGPSWLPELPDPRDGDPALTGVRQRGSVAPNPGRFVPEQPNRPLPPGIDPNPGVYANSPIETATVQTIYGAAAQTAPETIPQWVANLGAPALRGAEVSLR